MGNPGRAQAAAANWLLDQLQRPAEEPDGGQPAAQAGRPCGPADAAPTKQQIERIPAVMALFASRKVGAARGHVGDSMCRAARRIGRHHDEGQWQRQRGFVSLSVLSPEVPSRQRLPRKNMPRSASFSIWPKILQFISFN